MRWALVSGGGGQGRKTGSEPVGPTVGEASTGSLEWSVVELSGEPGLEHTGRTNRVFILAIACFSVLVAVWFTAYQGVKAKEVPSPPPEASAVLASAAPSAAPSATASLELLGPSPGTSVGDGIVPVSVRVKGATDQVHVSVESADGSTLGLASLAIGPDGLGRGEVRVFPAPVPTEARVRAFGIVDGSLVEALGTVTLRSDRDVGLWGIETVQRVDGGYEVRLDGWAPMGVTAIHLELDDPFLLPVASMTVRSGFEPSRPGAVAGQRLGIGSFGASLDAGSPSGSLLWLGLSWEDPIDGSTASIGRIVDLSSAVVEQWWAAPD